MSGAVVSDAVMIDLGEARDAPVLANRPASPRRRRLVGLLLAAAAVAVVAPTPPAPAFVEIRIPAVSGDGMDVFGDRLYITTPVTSGAEFRTVTAYRLPDGQRLWHAQMPLNSEGLNPLRLDDVVLIQAPDAENGQVTAVDDETGAILWHRRAAFVVGGVETTTSGTAEPLAVIGTMPAGTGPDVQAETISVIGLRDGQPRWTYRPPPEAVMEFEWRPRTAHVTRLVTGLPSGRIEVRDIVTGQVTATADLDRSVANQSGDDGPWLTTHNGLLLVAGGADGQLVSAFGMDRLDRRWTTRIDLSQYGLYGQADCGDLLCLGAGDDRMLAVDRRTGEIRWHGDWQWAVRVDGALIGGRIEGGQGVRSRLAVVDVATGQSRVDLGTWEFISWFAGDDDRGVVTRYDPAGHRAWVGLLDPAALDVRLLGPITDVIADCRAGDDAVVCRRIDGSVGIWRYR